MSEKEISGPETPRKPKRRVFRKIFKYLCLFILILILAAGGALVWLLGSESGQNFLVSEVNGLLGPAPGKPGLAYKITSLKGALPFDFEFGLEIYDSDGLWLAAPRNKFVLDWRQLPKNVNLKTLSILDAAMSRLPKLPPSPPAPPSKSFGVNELRDVLQKATDFLEAPPWWLPKISLDDIRVENFLLPAGFVLAEDGRPRVDLFVAASLIDGELKTNLQTSLKNAAGDAAKINDFAFDSLRAALSLNLAPRDRNLAANLSLETDVDNPVLEIKDTPGDLLGSQASLKLATNALASPNGATLALTGPGLAAGPFALKGEGKWQSGEGWRKGEIDGPVAYSLEASFAPIPGAAADDPLAALKSPLTLNINAEGDLPKISLNVRAACAEIEKAAHKIANLDLTLRSAEISLPLKSEKFDVLADENDIDLALKAAVDDEPVDLSTRLFFRALKSEEPARGDSPLAPRAGWLAGVRDLKLSALGAEAAGSLSALLRDGEKPALDGQISLALQKWNAINKFVPDRTISGDVKLDAVLKSERGNQTAAVNLAVPSLSLRPQKGDSFSVSGASLTANLNDIFNDLAAKAELKAAKIAAAGMNFNLDARVNGPVAGPLELDLNAAGDARASLAGVWSPGKALIKKLDASMEMPPVSGSGPKTRLGIKSGGQTQVTYGDHGVHIDRLEADVIPSGKLRVGGGFGPDKLDFSLDLASLNFKPWQKLVPSLPTGSASASVNLNGSPARPGGNFKLNLSGVVVPNVPLPPVTAALVGAIERSGAGAALKTRLEVDKSTLKALGASEASVSASLPLLFGADGVPKPDMNGALSAAVRWEGAIGPLWNLAPMADQRLNGRLDADVRAAGNLKAPRVQGHVKVNGARYENLLLGVLLTDINLDASLTQGGQKAPAAGLPGGLALKLSLSDGRGGTVTVNGKGDLDGANLDITSKIEKLKPLRRRDVHVELSGGVKVTGSAASPDVSGEIIVNQGEILLDNLDVASSVTTLPITVPDAKKPVKKTAVAGGVKKETGGPGRLNVRINMLPRFKIDGRGLASTWKANLVVAGPINNPKINGNISAVQGNFDFLGKNFALTQGSVTFAGGSPANPLLDIELTNEQPDLTAHILVTGPVDKMKLTMSSEPALPRDEILSRVLFGRSVNDLSKMEMLQLAGAVAQLAGFGGGGGLLSSVKKTLGVDVLRVGTSANNAAGDAGDEGLGGTTVEMGKYINDMIYMGVQQGMQPDSTAFIIQMELTPRTNLEVRTEQDNTWGGIKWKYDY